ncbi:MAG: copper chaperone PCu(A)C [Zetaproteobacteria bacterium]|nr:copper chaperone PCu(A)C [Zetaproteobacteria bacterium]
MAIKQWGMVWVLVMMSTGAQACDVTVTGAWLRLPPPVSDTAAAYMTLSNHCAQSKILQSISSPQASMTMMHDSNMQMMKSLVLRSGQDFLFHPKAAHVMLMGLQYPIRKKSHVSLVLHWQDGTSQRVSVPVKDMRGQSMHAMTM